MKLEVTTPTDFMGDVIGDLSSRRGMIQGTEDVFGQTVVRAQVPLANLFGYVTTLRSLTQGRASPSMEFDHYEPVPTNVAMEIRKARGMA